MTRSEAFMAFWKTINEFASSHDLPEVLYKEAREAYEILHHAWVEAQLDDTQSDGKDIWGGA